MALSTILRNRIKKKSTMGYQHKVAIILLIFVIEIERKLQRRAWSLV